MEGSQKEDLASGRQIARGAAWMMAFKLLDRSVGILSTVVLARLLTPKDFGLIAMAIAVMAILELMAAFGFDSALIQRQNTRREHFDTAWTFNVIFGIAIALLLILLALPAADFYRDPRLALILPSLALSALVGGFENIGTVAFRKDLDFRSEFRFLVAKRLVTFLITLVMALLLRNYWALIAGVVTGRMLSVAISYRLHPYRPRFSLIARADLLHFSKWLFLSNLVQTLQAKATDLVLGRTVGPHSLGVYNIAVEIAVMPSTDFVAPLNRAVYPAYSRLTGDLEALRRRFIDVYSLIALIAFPVAVGISCVAAIAVDVLLGDKWLEAIPIIRITSLCGLCSALQSNLYVVVLAMGQPRATTLLSAALFVVSLPVLVFASLAFGVNGAAFAYLVTALLGLSSIVYVFCRISAIPLRVLGLAVWRPCAAAVVMAGVVLNAENLLAVYGQGLPSVLSLLALVSIGVLSYVTCVAALWFVAGKPVGTERTIIGNVNRTIRTMFSSRTG